MQDWLSVHDWFVKTVYLTDEWVEQTLPMFEVMRDNGFMESDEKDPIFEVVAP